MRTFFSVVVLLIASVLTTGQTSIREVVNVTSNPTGTSCAPRRLYKNTVNNTIWQRNSVTGQCEQITGGATGAPTDATYITQTANGSLSAEQALNSLSSGIMRVATTTGAITSLTDSAGIAANIADETGTDKLVFNTSPNFTTSLSLGTNPAQSGGVRLPNNTSVSARNAANSSDLSLLNLNGSNVLQLLGGVFVLDTDGNFVTSAQGGMHDINMGGGWWVQRAEGNGGIGFGSGHKICWTSTTTNTANPPTGDACLTRNGAGVLEVSDGTVGTLRDITFRSFRGNGTGPAQFKTAQTTAPTCTSNCGTSPSVVGTDTFMRVTMGTSGSPASGWVVTFNGTWDAAPVCTIQMAKAGMVVGKMALTAVTTTTTITVVTNGTAPSTTDVYAILCGGTQ